MSLILDHLIDVLARKFTFFKIMHKHHRMHIRGNRVPVSFGGTLTNSKVHTTKEKNVRPKLTFDALIFYQIHRHFFANLLESFHKKLNEIRIRILWDHIGLLVSSWQQYPCSQYTIAHPRNTCLSITHRYFKRGHRRLGLCTFHCHSKDCLIIA